MKYIIVCPQGIKVNLEAGFTIPEYTVGSPGMGISRRIDGAVGGDPLSSIFKYTVGDMGPAEIIQPLPAGAIGKIQA